MRPYLVAATGLSGLAALHAFWVTGSPWPLRSRAEYTEIVTGSGQFPSPRACLAGRTDLVSPGSTSPRFRSADRRFYAPLCLTLAALAAPAAARRGRNGEWTSRTRRHG